MHLSTLVLGDYLVHELEELDRATSGITFSQHFAGASVERGEQVRGAVTDVVMGALLGRGEVNRQQGWWQEYADVLQPEPLVPDHLDTYIALEADASALLAFQAALVHGLLQTEDYARAITEAMASEHDEHEVDRLI